MIGWVIFFSVLGSIGAITAAATFLLLGEELQKSLVSIFITFAIGTMLATALLGLIPEAIEGASEPRSVMYFVLGGIIFFFLIEKLVIWRNCQKEDCEVHSAAGPLVLIGDAFHNFVDGIVIAASFLTNFHIGLIVGLSILAHEIPQELGDFGILLHQGYSKKKAYIYNTLSSLTTIPAAIVGYYLFSSIIWIAPFTLAVSAASFIYIALSDLTPELHKKVGFKHIIRQIFLISVGIAVMVLILMFGGHHY